MSRLKFTIHGFQQHKLIEHGLDNNDALVMSVIKDMYASASVESVLIEEERFIWVNQTQLREFVPIIGSLRTIQRIFEKLRKAKVFDSHVSYEKKGVKGTFYFIKPAQLFDDLAEYVTDVNIPTAKKKKGTTKCHRGVRQNDVEGYDKMAEGGTTNCRNKDSSTNDSSTNDQNNITNISPEDRLVAHGVESQVLKDFMKVRKAKRLPLTHTAVDGLEREARKASLEVKEAIRICAERGWGGFNSSWYIGPAHKTGSQSQVQDFNAQDYGKPIIPEKFRRG